MVGCKTTPCAFSHKTRDLVSVVHGDDFITAGPARDIDLFEKEMAKHLEIVCNARLGLGSGCSKEGKILNREVRVDQNGISWEDELAIQELGLTTARPQLSPGGAKVKDGDEEIELDAEAKSAYRTVTARANYFASDRPADTALRSPTTSNPHTTRNLSCPCTPTTPRRSWRPKGTRYVWPAA